MPSPLYPAVSAGLSLCLALLAGCGSPMTGGPSGAAGQSPAGAGGAGNTTGAAGNMGTGGQVVAGQGGNPGTAGQGGQVVTGQAGAAGSGSGGSNPTGVAGNPPGGMGGSATGGSAGGAAGRGGGPAGAGGSGATGGAEQYPVPNPIPPDEDGAQLWLRYKKVPLAGRLAEYMAAANQVVTAGSSATLQAAQSELVTGLSGLLGTTVTAVAAADRQRRRRAGNADLVDAGQRAGAGQPPDRGGKRRLSRRGRDDQRAAGDRRRREHGHRRAARRLRAAASHADAQAGCRPGAERRPQDQAPPAQSLGQPRRHRRARLRRALDLVAPSANPQRLTVYARANASIGINGTVINNVNADAQVLTAANLAKVKTIADRSVPTGSRVYLSARFSAPIEIGGQSTADPTNASVKSWWASKVTEIYTMIPDFGGFLVKANSEGQPGPQGYGRTHADGAKMFSDALGTRGGVVLWRAFVYADNGMDRIRQAYDEFKPMDGTFGANAMVQVKNGPLDFQPREPFSPLFGAMPARRCRWSCRSPRSTWAKTRTSPTWARCTKRSSSPTPPRAPGSTVARVIDGTVHGNANTAIAGVANIGLDTNWTGSHFNQANWYVFGRMAWDPDVTASTVADEWVRQTFSNDPVVVTPVTAMMMSSRQTLVNYMTPLGLAHIMGTDHHYGPAPWVNNLPTANWNPFYYHKADGTGIGFDRTTRGQQRRVAVLRLRARQVREQDHRRR